MTNTSPGPLTGKVALVTGGSRGIGAATVKRLAQDGAAVALTYANAQQKAEEVVQAIEAIGGKALSIQADSGNVDEVKSAVATTVQTFGRLDILINNVGILMLAPIDDVKFEDFTRLIEVNIQGVFVAAQEAIRHMSHGGRIINIGSVNSDYIPYSNGSVYALTKGAITAFTRGLARDLGPRGITVNTVQPGPIDTEMNPADGPFSEGIKGYTALQRYGNGDEVASLISYLASPEAAYITGANLKVDGGYTA
jgi:3-oxoacyl-[acyl-carrier protein] reductase